MGLIILNEKRKYKKEDYTGNLGNDIVCPECKSPISGEFLISRLSDFDIIVCENCLKRFRINYSINSMEAEN